MVGIVSGVCLAQAKPLARSAEVDRPLSQVYRSLTTYFAPDSMHFFQIRQASEPKGVIVAYRSGIDQNTWNQWAYCKVAPLNMLDSLRQATAVVNIKLQRNGPFRTDVTVTPTLTAVYGLGASQHTVECDSRGVLEDDIFTAAGAKAK